VRWAASFGVRICVTILSGALVAVLVLAGTGEAGTVAAEVRVSDRQGQGGKEIRVVAFVIAHEPLTASARGTVRVAGEDRRLYLKGGARPLASEEGYALKLRPSIRVAKLIADALNRGRHPVASFTVRLENESGVVQTTHHRVTLTR